MVGTDRGHIIIGMQASTVREGKQVLVISFNKAVAETINCKRKEQNLYARAKAQTLDSLCYQACKPKAIHFPWNDRCLVEKYWPKSQLWPKINAGTR